MDGGIPVLTELRITASSTGDAAAPMKLVPEFSSKIFDYYVRCTAGMNLLSISVAASPGAESVIFQPFPSGSAPKQTVLMGVLEGQAIVAVATDGRASQDYWVRCLPHDFPHMEMKLHPGAGTPSPGYYLVGNLVGQGIGDAAYAMILDGQGVPVWYASQIFPNTVYDVDNIVPGAVSFANPFQIQVLSPSSTSYVTFEGQPTDEHDLRVLPNGDFLVIWSPVQTGVDLTGLTLPAPDGGTETFGPNESIIACDIVEVTPFGVPVWFWQATDYFDPVKDIRFLETPAQTTGGLDGGPIVEPFHCNSIDVDENGNVLVSARHMDSIFYVDRKTGNVLWKMGGARYTKDGATYVPVADSFHRQHDARLQPAWKGNCYGGKGQISVFDDETSEDASARAVIYDVEIGAGDGGAADCAVPADAGPTKATVAWQYVGDASSLALGSFRVQSDGRRVIGWGTNTNVAFSEVDEDKHVLLEFSFTDGNQTYRAIKVPIDAFDLNVLRTTAGR